MDRMQKITGFRHLEGFRSLARSTLTAMKAANSPPRMLEADQKLVREQASVKADPEMVYTKWKRIHQHVNENAKLKMKLNEGSKILQDLDSKAKATKFWCDEQCATLQQLASQTEQAAEKLVKEQTSVASNPENLIDLAGSESSRVETTGLQRKEGSYINKSLLTLGTKCDGAILTSSEGDKFSLTKSTAPSTPIGESVNFHAEPRISNSLAGENLSADLFSIGHGEFPSGSIHGEEIPLISGKMIDHVDLLREQLKILSGEVALQTSVLKRLTEEAGGSPHSENIQKISDEIKGKKRQIASLEREIAHATLGGQGNADKLELSPSYPELLEQLNEKSFELEYLKCILKGNQAPDIMNRNGLKVKSVHELRQRIRVPLRGSCSEGDSKHEKTGEAVWSPPYADGKEWDDNQLDVRC
ncbi:centromere-associated protein E [Panicum miliaceum]|uniref:Centromere-associated protein E n=1 Tax=Panicum miliaceum TaxID=4540 RepID=A0A3L6Q6P9_PANMI|nr:centromere-associated protein E [Panicum miliaceum]